MSELVDELKNEHKSIVEILNKVNNIGISIEEVQSILIGAKSSLLAHLKKEDEQLYPVLIEAAERDADLKLTLEVFASDMNIVSKAALDFFDKYSEGVQQQTIANDFRRLFTLLSQRIIKEENIIFTKYDELKQ